MILGVIPARGGSKGIARKNLRNLCGKPLVAWSIEAAKESKLMDDFVVSTDDIEIANFATRFSARVLNRPPELALDETPMISVLRHSLQTIPADLLVLLQPTSPIRDSGLVDRCIRRFIESGADSLATGFMCLECEYGNQEVRRQDKKGFFCDDGNVYVFKEDIIRAGERTGKRVDRMILDKEQNIDIDDEFDFWLAEQVLRRRMQCPQR